MKLGGLFLIEKVRDGAVVLGRLMNALIASRSRNFTSSLRHDRECPPILRRSPPDRR